MVVNVPWTDTDTTYSAATSSTLGLSKLEDDTVQSAAANSITTTASRTYGIQNNSSGQLVVNVPWTDTDTTYSTATSDDAGLMSSDDFNKLDITSGTVTASKAVVVDANKDISGFRNISATGSFSGNLTGTASNATALNTTIDGIVKTTNGDGTLSIGNLVSGDIPDNSANTSGNAGSVTNGVYTTDKLSALSETTSTELASIISDETGSGSLVFATSPTLVTPVLGTPSSGTLTNCTGYPTSSLDGTISNTQLAGSIANGKLTNSSITIAGTATSLGGTITADAIINAGTGISQSDADNGTTVIGASNGKVGFFGVTAVEQQSNIVDAESVQGAASGAPTESDFNGLRTDVQNLTAKVNAILTALEALGLLASS